MLGVVRPDVNVAQVIQVAIGIAKTSASEPGQVEHLVRIARDALRYQPDALDCSPGGLRAGEKPRRDQLPA
jgi:hypothetical protein